MRKDLFEKNVLWVAHRGIPSMAIENTANSFEIASKLPFYGMECDIHLTKDNVIVVHHDGSTLRLTGKDIWIKDATYQELLDLDFSFPTLKEYLDICKSGDKVAIIELKADFSVEQIEFIYNKVSDESYLGKTVFISFHRNNLLYMRMFDKKVPMQFLTSKFNEEIFAFCLENNIDFNFNHSTVTKEVMTEVRKTNLKVNCFTVNKLEVALELIELGVDYITTDGIK